MIDLHCHIDLFPKPREVIAKAVAHDVFVLSVTTTPSAWPGTSALAVSQRTIQTALGLHPQLAKERLRELPLFDQYLSEAKWIGEIGLDGSPENRDSWSVQVKVFEHILQSCTNAGGRLMSIHSRRAASPVIDCLKKFPGAGIFVLHWFSGTPKELEEAVRRGCWFSIGLPMLLSKKGRDLVLRIPRDRLLTETDGPFTGIDGSPSCPWDVVLAENALSEVWNATGESTRSMLAENLRRLQSTLQ